MNTRSTIKVYIEAVLKTSGFAVLATEGNGQPHASLIAITPFGNFRQIIFATYRNGVLHALIRLCSYSGKCPIISGRSWD